MAFVKTAEEIQQIAAVLQTPRFTDARRGYLTFRTDPEFIADVLPPGLEPGAEPSITVTVGQFGSNCVGDFLGSTISIAARHRKNDGETDGAYVLTMFMSTDHAIIFGRDLFGEPKKQAEMSLNIIGNQFRGTVDRMGVRLVDLSISLGDDAGPGRSHANSFNIKAQPAADGSGLEADAVITLAQFTNDLTVNRAGQGTLILGGNIHDPLTDIPIVEIVAAGYVEGDLSASVTAIDTIPAAAFLPYAYGRMDHWPALDTSMRRANAAE